MPVAFLSSCSLSNICGLSYFLEMFNASVSSSINHFDVRNNDFRVKKIFIYLTFIREQFDSTIFHTYLKDKNNRLSTNQSLYRMMLIEKNKKY